MKSILTITISLLAAMMLVPLLAAAATQDYGPDRWPRSMWHHTLTD